MNRVAVFARWPEPGRVKTRLSPALPAALACELYRAMLADALAAAAEAAAGDRSVHWSDAPGDEAAARETPPGFEARSQIGADLGERLANAFGALLREPRDRAVVIGADCPELDASLVNRALESLETHDLAIGPARDGGYYLIGLSRPAARLFRGVAWGTERVFATTIDAARGEGLTIATLPELDDVDTPADLVRWIATLLARAAGDVGGAARSSHGVEALRRMKLLP